MTKQKPCFADGTPMKKWHRAFCFQVCEYTLSKAQAREIIKLNPYLKKHENDFERCFEECGGDINSIFSAKEYPHHLEDYKKEVLKIK